ncbi:hypothetical protein PIROE2DRAFT_8468, partial [Piromyces sp. E2]
WKDFIVKIIICEYITLQEAVNNIKKNFISKEEILRQRLNSKKEKGSDDDIEATSSIVSLRCPISRARIKTPCRFKECTHVQCFDLTSYLQLNEKYPNWKCPVCNTRYSWKSLVMDGYIQDILNNVSLDVDSIVVEVNGTWHIDKTSEVKPTVEEEFDEEEDRYFKKLEEELKAGESVIDLTSDDDIKSTQSSTQSSSVISVHSTPTLSTSTVLSIPSISIPNYNSTSTTESNPSRKRTMADLVAPRRKKANGKSNSSSTSTSNKTIDNSNSTTSPFNLIRPKTSLSTISNTLQSTTSAISNLTSKTKSNIPNISNISNIIDLTNVSNISDLANLQNLANLVNITNPPNTNIPAANILDSNNPLKLSNINGLASLASTSSNSSTTKGKKTVDLLPKVTKPNPYFVGLPNLSDISQSLALSQLSATLSQDMNYDLIASSIDEIGNSSLPSNPSLTAQTLITNSLLNDSDKNTINADSSLLNINTSTDSTVDKVVDAKANDTKSSNDTTDLTKALDKNSNITDLTVDNILDITNSSSNDIPDPQTVTESPLTNIPSIPISSSLNSPSIINSGNLGVQPSSLELFSNNSLLDGLTSSSGGLKTKPSITIPTSIPISTNTSSITIPTSIPISTNTNTSSITIPTSIPISTNTSSITIPKSYSSPLPLFGLSASQRKKEEENLRSSLLKSALFNHSIAPNPSKSTSTASPLLSSTTPKLKSASLSNSPRLSSPRLNSPRFGSRPGTPHSTQSSPGLGIYRTPTKYKNITPKPVKTTPSFDLTTLSQLNSFNQYLSLLSSMNPAHSTNPISSAPLTNPLINSLLPLGTPPDPSSLLYYQSLNSLASGSSLLTNTNDLSQLATPPPIPPLCDTSILSALQTVQNSSNSNMASSLNAFLGSDLANSFALALGASVNPTTTSNSTTKISTSSVATTPIGEIAKNMTTPVLTPDMMETDTPTIISTPITISDNDNDNDKNTSTTIMNTSSTNIGASTDASALLNSLNAATGSSSNTNNAIASLNIPITIDDDNTISPTSTTLATSAAKVMPSTAESALSSALSASAILSSATPASNTISSTAAIPNTSSADLLQNMNLYLNQLFGLNNLPTSTPPPPPPPFNPNDPNFYSLMMSNPAMASALASSTQVNPSQLDLLNALNAAAAMNPISSTTTATASSTTNTADSSSSNQVKTPNLSIPFTNLPFI